MLLHKSLTLVAYQRHLERPEPTLVKELIVVLHFGLALLGDLLICCGQVAVIELTLA